MLKHAAAAVLAATLSIALAGPVLANSCPKHMANIDKTLATSPKLEPAKLEEVKKLRADGEAFHKAGKHAESEAALGKAESILGIENVTARAEPFRLTYYARMSAKEDCQLSNKGYMRVKESGPRIDCGPLF